MGSVVIIFLPILLPYLLICAVAGNFGYGPLDVLFGPLELALGGIIEVFFGGSDEAFFSFMDSFSKTFLEKFTEFMTENEDVLMTVSKKIGEFLAMLV